MWPHNWLRLTLWKLENGEEYLYNSDCLHIDTTGVFSYQHSTLPCPDIHNTTRHELMSDDDGLEWVLPVTVETIQVIRR